MYSIFGQCVGIKPFVKVNIGLTLPDCDKAYKEGLGPDCPQNMSICNFFKIPHTGDIDSLE